MKKHARQVDRRQRGMTLIELMVAVALLAMMIAAFSMILNSVQKLVYGSQAVMRSNASASAIEYVIRKDVRSISMNGFLCISQSTSGTPQLFYATAGTTASITSSALGDGAITGMGLCKVEGTTNTMMWRASLVLAGSSATTGDDVLNTWNFSNIQNAPSRQYLNNTVVEYCRANLAPGSLPVPPDTLDEIAKMWKYLAENCTNLTIMWTDGERSSSGSLKWYGAGSPKDSSYASRNVGSIDGDGDFYTEFNHSGYRALWSQHNQNDWPKAIKVSFTITDSSKSTGTTSILYEIICPLGE